MWEALGVFRYELLMFLFAFEVNDAQDTCTCKCRLWRFRHTGEAACHRRSLQAELPEASPVLWKLRHVYGLTFILQILMGSNLMLGFSVCIVELFKDNHILSGKSRSVEGKGTSTEPPAFLL